MSANKPTTVDEDWSAARLAAAQVIANGGRYADAGEVVQPVVIHVLGDDECLQRLSTSDGING